MRIRKVPRFVSPLVSTARACLQMKEFAHGGENARRESDEEKSVRELNHVSEADGVAAPRAAAPAAASHGASRDLVLLVVCRCWFPSCGVGSVGCHVMAVVEWCDAEGLVRETRWLELECAWLVVRRR